MQSSMLLAMLTVMSASLANAAANAQLAQLTALANNPTQALAALPGLAASAATKPANAGNAANAANKPNAPNGAKKVANGKKRRRGKAANANAQGSTRPADAVINPTTKTQIFGLTKVADNKPATTTTATLRKRAGPLKKLRKALTGNKAKAGAAAPNAAKTKPSTPKPAVAKRNAEPADGPLKKLRKVLTGRPKAKAAPAAIARRDAEASYGFLPAKGDPMYGDGGLPVDVGNYHSSNLDPAPVKPVKQVKHMSTGSTSKNGNSKQGSLQGVAGAGAGVAKGSHH